MNEAQMAPSGLIAAETGRRAASGYVIAVLALNDGLPLLQSLSRNCQSGFSCAPHWLAHWATHVNNNIAIVTATRNGRLVLALALEVIKQSGLHVARFVGGHHANGNFPAMCHAFTQAEAEALLEQLQAQLRHKPWSVDVIVLERQLAELGGINNPLLAKGQSKSPNISLHLNVDQSFDAVLDTTRSAKRKRKRHRSQQRKYQAAGGFSVSNPVAKEFAASLLDQYFAMKAYQLKNIGASNTFRNVNEQAFFKALFSDPTPHPDHDFYLSSLDVGGKIRAIHGSCLHGLRQMVQFTAFSDDELNKTSPGDFLNFALIEAACQSKTQIYDLGVGDEAYKRSWCDVETWHYDAVIGITLRGKLAKLQLDAVRCAKRCIKNNQHLWSFARRIRKLRAGRNFSILRKSVSGNDTHS
jgi:CelD/BcsL family acetyltransferase involved in cellulose biosynthesis